jgi:hypothetical protein
MTYPFIPLVEVRIVGTDVQFIVPCERGVACISVLILTVSQGLCALKEPFALHIYPSHTKLPNLMRDLLPRFYLRELEDCRVGQGYILRLVIQASGCVLLIRSLKVDIKELVLSSAKTIARNCPIAGRPI